MRVICHSPSPAQSTRVPGGSGSRFTLDCISRIASAGARPDHFAENEDHPLQVLVIDGLIVRDLDKGPNSASRIMSPEAVLTGIWYRAAMPERLARGRIIRTVKAWRSPGAWTVAGGFAAERQAQGPGDHAWADTPCRAAFSRSTAKSQRERSASAVSSTSVHERLGLHPLPDLRGRLDQGGIGFVRRPVNLGHHVASTGGPGGTSTILRAPSAAAIRSRTSAQAQTRCRGSAAPCGGGHQVDPDVGQLAARRR